ncbi:hypothetical protein J2858_001347 [Neorhizobium galegae]|uniref:hypothetical protein n=1 Tax=Neorhizobium galegae TaxID=399 RepID=UPI001AE720DD|nr:hypothetical protein [Neorhizobium galegae]MBP2548454.1 hypothetical protein [Neorhizobium galegae]
MENPETGMGIAQQRAGEDANAAVRSEISALRAEIASIREKLTEFSGEAYESVARSAGSAAAYVQDEASSVAGAIRQHPATATTLMTLVGGIGFAIGYLVASTSFEQKQAWYRRYYS